MTAVALVGLVVLLAVRLGATPDTERTAPAASTSLPSLPVPTATDAADVPARAWPAELHAGGGTLYLTTGGSVLAVDAGTGLVTDTGLPVEGDDVRLTVLPGGLLVWHPEGRRNRLLLYGLDTGTPPGGALAGRNRFLSAGGSGVWAARGATASTAATVAWDLVDASGRAGTSVEVHGRAVADGAGGLLAVADGAVRPVWPRTSRTDPRADAGAVVATGPDGYLVQRCTRGTCTTVLREGPERTRRVLDRPVAGSAVDGALSPGNRFVLLSQLVWDAPAVQVRPLGSDRPLRTFAGGGGSATWLSGRWVAFLARDGLVLYDAVDDVVVDADLPLTGATRLAWQPT